RSSDLFYMSEHTPSVRFVMSRNPEYWDPDFALLDSIEQPILPEYATRQAQFKAGEILASNTWAAISMLRAEDVLVVKQDQPEINIYEAPMSTSSAAITFGLLPAGQSPFLDERVRQAFSMAFDRDLDIAVRNNVEEFEAAGLPVRTTWNSHLAGRDQVRAGGFFLDPKESEFGENAQFFQYNPEDAK